MIPYFKVNYWGNEKKYLLDALDSTWISGGYYVEKFENKLSEFLNIPYCLTTSNGTSAIELAYLTLGLKTGDEIIVPGFGFMALANVAVNFGLKVKFADVDINTWLINPQAILDNITPNTKAVAITHTYGNVCDIEKISKICKTRGIFLIEDCAEALASKYDNKYVGSFGDVSIFSFHATKLITTGEGGLFVTNNPDLYQKAKMIRSHGLKTRGTYFHEDYGMNFRMSNLLAAVGLAQLENIETIINKKSDILTIYKNKLGNYFDTQFEYKYSQPIYWTFGIRHFLQSKYLELLKYGEVEARGGFLSPQYLPIYGTPNLPNSDLLSNQVITLPSYPGIMTEEIDYICKLLLKGIG